MHSSWREKLSTNFQNRKGAMNIHFRRNVFHVRQTRDLRYGQSCGHTTVHRALHCSMAQEGKVNIGQCGLLITHSREHHMRILLILVMRTTHITVVFFFFL